MNDIKTQYVNANGASYIDFLMGNLCIINLNANASFSFNAKDPSTFVLQLKQGAGGNKTVTWPSNVVWDASAAPTLSTAEGSIDVIFLVWDGVKFNGVYSNSSSSSATLTIGTGSITASLQDVKDTSGNESVLQISTSALNINALSFLLGGYQAIKQYQADNADSTRWNLFIGREAGEANVGTGYANTIVGYRAGIALNGNGPSSSSNVIIGYQAGTSVSTGSFNTICGTASGTAITTEQYNTIYGYHAFKDATGASNTAIGFQSLNSNTASSNVAVGANASYLNTSGTRNVSVGSGALRTNVISDDNTAVGFEALYASIGTGSTGENTAVGARAGASLTDGYVNTFVGTESGRLTTSGIRNVFLGRRAGYSNVTGNENVYIGTNAAENSTGSNNIVIGYNAATPATGTSNCVVLGNASITLTILRGKLNAAGMPTSSAGLSAGDLWSDGGTIKIV